MKKKSFCMILVITISVLFSSACNAPILSQFLPDAGSSGDSSSAEPSEAGVSASEPEMEVLHNTDGAELTLIPGATFQMGSSAADTLAAEDEIPQHQVAVDEFYLYTYEVTNQMYTACVESGYCMRPQMLESGPTSHYEDPDYAENPIVGVDWVMARDYCSWAGGRLPTEAEWELASRGPESLLYPWGSELPTCDYVNMGGCLVPPDTRQVGYYLLSNSPDDVWDLSGNVWEWVHDWYADDYYAQSPADNPIGPLEPQDPDTPERVIRGGGLNSEPAQMRSAARKGLNPYRVYTDVGFRCVAGEGLVLPAAYDPGVDRHERVPPDSADGGDSAEDPDGGHFIWAVPVTGPCPDGSGMIELNIPSGASLPVTAVATRYDFDWWDETCEYDPAAEISTCIGPEPLDYLLGPPPSFPIDLCIGTGEWAECINDLPIQKPTDCFPFARQLRIEVATDCVGPAEERTPGVIIELDPGSAEFTHATANGILLTCSAAGENAYTCSGLPGSPGDELAVTIFFSDGSSPVISGLVYPDCRTTIFGAPWVLSGRGCLPHEGSDPEYYAVIDTHLDVTFTSWRLEGVEAPKVCAEDPIIGRWYCNFAMRDWYTSLTFCAAWVGGAGERCETFPASQFGDLLPERCDPPGFGEVSCSDFNEAECLSHPVLCQWDSKGGVCYPR
jgi:formylglycine-generating enzyme required for sulfatase activity